jgi:rSAM/selenodomain-associated transferase 1
MSSRTSSTSVPPGRDARLIVMARHPAPGRVKTRLAATLGAERTCALYRAFVLDLAGRLDALPYDVTWAYWPSTAPFATLLPGAHCRPQRGGDLGERMANAVAECGGPAVVIGADAPHVPAARLEEAVEALAGAADLVLGPADDGGYYLIGLRAPTPALFAGVAWGTPRVLAETLARAGGLRTRLLEPCFDVDTPADLARLSGLLARGDVALPRTAALLAIPPPGP